MKEYNFTIGETFKVDDVWYECNSCFKYIYDCDFINVLRDLVRKNILEKSKANRYELIKEDVLNAYILDKDENKIVTLCSTKRPDLGFDKLEVMIGYANEYLKTRNV